MRRARTVYLTPASPSTTTPPNLLPTIEILDAAHHLDNPDTLKTAVFETSPPIAKRQIGSQPRRNPANPPIPKVTVQTKSASNLNLSTLEIASA